MTAPTVSFSNLVESVETLAKVHVGQARAVVVAAFKVDRFQAAWLDKALTAVNRDDSNSRSELVRVLESITGEKAA